MLKNEKHEQDNDKIKDSIKTVETIKTTISVCLLYHTY